MKKTLCISLVFCFLAVSCTVKEDRSDCPCILTIDFSSCNENKETLSVKGWTGADALFDYKVLVKDYPDGMRVTVPKGRFRYNVCAMASSYHISGTSVFCPLGKQAGALFAYKKTLIASGEEAYDRVYLHKQYAVLNISFGNNEGDNAGITEIRIRADYNGMSLDDLSPIAGAFSSTAAASDGYFSISLPRQGDGKIIMDIYAGEDHVKEIDLAAVLLENGYSWESEDLNDAWIDFDMGQIKGDVESEDWEEGTT